MSKGTALMRLGNEKRTLALLRRNEQISRLEIAQSLNLSKNTISLIIDKYLKDGVVRETGIEDQGGVGRPRIRLTLVPEALKSVGILIQDGFGQFVVTDYRSTILELGQIPLDASDPERCIDKLIVLCQRLCKDHPQVLGIGIAVPALVDSAEGVVRFSSRLNWENVRLKERMDRELPVETRILNNVKASAIAPTSVIPQEESANLFYVCLDEGVGGAHIMGSQIYSGASWTAGEVGHLCVDPLGPRCSCGQKGCLEALVSVPAIRRRIRARVPEALTDDDLRCLAGSASAEDPRIEEIIRETGEYVGIAVSQIVTLLNPGTIIIDSPFEGAEAFRKAVREALGSRALAYPLKHTVLRFVNNPGASSAGAAFSVILDYEAQ